MMQRLGKYGYFAAVLWVMLQILSGCTVSQSPGGMNADLVSKENPIFDKSFEKLSFQDIDLKNMWVEREKSESQENVAIHNNTFADVAEMVKAGVVNIYTRNLEEKEARVGVSPNDIIRIPLLSNLFDIIPFKVPIPFKSEGFSLGSGFIINEQGYILTNAHVIHNATDIRVVLSEGRREYPAKIVGADRVTDTALIRIESDQLLTPLPLGNSDRLRIGEMVLAIGNPLGLRHSVTSGIVSATERISPGLNEKLVDFIQTDSAINPGNSGGPLVNLHGEVVGINTAMVTQAHSIGFAIPINTVKKVMPMLVLGKTERGWLGIQAIPLMPNKAFELKYPHEGGVLVVAVEKDSPAEKSGLKPDDIIIGLNGHSIGRFLLLRRELLSLSPGVQLSLTVFRDGATLEIKSTLEKKEKETEK
ncbi:MAG TPA: trypsin-like peptidase domain-containing protein [Desulfobacteria bacterium]|nr:trypsin-like peptidase domain-containing protein [Desulfobacteria bacterium]